MIQKIHIQNFRCFENFKAEGFERINLIGGKNNSGKTCLLEAIACFLSEKAINEVANVRMQIAKNLFNTNSLNKKIIISLFNKNHKDKNGDFESKLTVIDENEQIISILETIYPSSKGTYGLSGISLTFFYLNKEVPRLNINKSFDDLDKKLLKPQIIDLVRIIDSRIEDLRTFSTEAGLWIKTFENVYEPLSNYGDAIQNVLRYFTPIIEKELNALSEIPISFLLIDEIENGIHYSVHEEFWENLFKLSDRLNVQIFATTHSREMISAFNNASMKFGGAAYFEMARDIDSNEIFAQKHDTNLLQYELETPKSTFRGE